MTAALLPPSATSLLMRAEALARRYQRMGLKEDADQIQDAIVTSRERIRASEHKPDSVKHALYRDVAEDLQAMLDVYDFGSAKKPEQIAAVEDEYLTIAQLSQVVGRKYPTIWQWIQKHRLESHGTDTDGSKLYSRRAVKELAQQYLQRKPVDKSPKPVDNPPVSKTHIVEAQTDAWPTATLVLLPHNPPQPIISSKPTKWSIKDKSILNTFIPEPFSNGWEVA